MKTKAMKSAAKRDQKPVSKPEQKAKRKPYTMSEAALAQRRAARMKPDSCHDWRSAKVSAELMDWAREKFGTVNNALKHYHAKDIARAKARAK